MEHLLGGVFFESYLGSEKFEEKWKVFYGKSMKKRYN